MNGQRRIVGLLAGLVLVAVAGCGGGGQQLTEEAIGTQAINPRDPATLRDGGDLRLPLDALPDNFNYNQTDGPSADTDQIISALMPRTFVAAADGSLAIDANYLQSAEITNTAPQTITYRINPAARWNSGRPITWQDFEAQWQAQNGSVTAFDVASTTGYEDIGSVVRGANDQEVVVTFRKTFAEWPALFSPLYPFETNRDPARFNQAWRTAVLDSAGPFSVESINEVAQSAVLVRNPGWWGPKPRLNRLIFTVTERSALADRLANNEIDWYEIGSSVDLFQRARTIPGVEIRQAPERTYNHITFNGAPGSIMADPALRRAIAKGIDRQAIGQRLVGQITAQVTLVQNHIFAPGSKGYQDNTGGITYDQESARRELDALGWTLQGDQRSKDGKPLTLRYIATAANPISEVISRSVLEQLAQIGVQVSIQAVPSADFFDQYVRVGNFDLTGFGWVLPATPFSSGKSLYAQPVGSEAQQNYGRVFSPEILALYDQGLQELDPAKRIEIANRADQLIWQEVHHLPLYAAPGAHAVRATVANFGAKGLGDWDYVNAGFTQ